MPRRGRREDAGQRLMVGEAVVVLALPKVGNRIRTWEAHWGASWPPAAAAIPSCGELLQRLQRPPGLGQLHSR
jgi:hypothetical protein